MDESEDSSSPDQKAGMRSRYSVNKKKNSKNEKPVLLDASPPQLKVHPKEGKKVTIEMESESMVVIDRAMKERE